MSPRKTGVWLFVIATLGLVDALYLTYDHGAFHADPGGYGGGLCGADGGCSISRSSMLSEIPLPGADLGLPTSVLALGFYAVFIALTIYRRRAEGDLATDLNDATRATPPPAVGNVRRLQLALAILANVYSLFLFGYSLAHGSVCKFCAVLYALNAALLFVCWRSLGESFKSALGAAWRAITSKAAALALGVMLVVLAGGYVIYRGQVLAAREKVPPLTTLDTTGRPATGPADARVHIVEFADFECPHCRIAFQTLEEVLAERKDVRLTFLHFPLDQACNPMIDRPFHARACELAVIGECAHRQGHFYDAAGPIFAAAPTAELLAQLADKGLDKGKLEACIADGGALEQVKKDIQAGIAAKITGTPAVFLNGALVGGALPKDKLLELIDVAARAASAPH